MRVVALGGGHGLAASLTALRALAEHITAIVTVADNGGSSGRLRNELAALPPGDLRMALAALCPDDRVGQDWASFLQHRFNSTGSLNQHPIGNLLLVGIWDWLQDPVEGLQMIANQAGIKGQVLPMALTPLNIIAEVSLDPAQPNKIAEIIGQAEVATTAGFVHSVRLEPADAPVCPAAATAIASADWLVFGPGSWFSSVMPHLLLPAQLNCLLASPAKKLVNLNLMAQPGETQGFDSIRHLEVFQQIAPELKFDIVLADQNHLEQPAKLAAYVANLGAELVVADIANSTQIGQHHPEKLAAAYREIFQSA